MIKLLKSSIVFVIAGLLCTLYLHKETLLWIYKAWVYSPFVDGQGPFIAILALLGFSIRWKRLQDKTNYFSTYGIAVLAGSLALKVIADQVNIHTLAALSMCISIASILIFVLGKQAISLFFPFWFVLGAMLPTIPYLFDITFNQFFTMVTNALTNILSIKAGISFFDSSPFYFWLASVSYGNYLASPVFVFSYATFFSIWQWERIKISWARLTLLWLEIPIIRLLSASLLTITLGEQRVPYITTGIYLGTATCLFLVTLRMFSWKRNTKIS
ncbi:MAG: archaeosortase/exosortase family protein [Candidatus Omnitrophica bacterium]|nr:archaeosortase/exosortase family protein [Candidatus Omnitrophota bacterium]